MSSDWSSLGRHLQPAVLGALAGWVVVLAWRVLTVDFARVAVPLAFVAAGVAAVGALARWRRWPALMAVPLQWGLAALVLLFVTSGSAVPVPSNVGVMRTVLEAAVTSAQDFAAPVPANVPPVHPLLLVGGALVLLLMDLLVGTLRRASLSGIVLLTAYSLPVTVTGNGVSWWIFVTAATLFLALVFVEHNHRLAAWGRSAEESSGFSVRTGAVSTTATALGAGAIGLALVMSLVVPTMSTALFEGPGPGTRDVEVKNPVVDMRRDLTRGEDVPLLWVTTDGPRPDYLRLSVLTRFVDGRWTPGDRDIPESQAAVGELPPLEGVSADVPRVEAEYRVSIGSELDSTWLPTTSQVTRINAGTDWRYDTSTRDFIAAADDVTAAQRDYDFTGVTLEPDAAAMDRAVSGAGTVRSIFTETPPDLDNEIRRLAQIVTADADTRYRKAQALQEFFRTTGGFRYDVSQADSLGDGTADLLAFLDEEDGRVGYCEQFAGSMAIMARTLGIPSRVAVGFLQPARTGDDTWEYSAWDLHAWPELYFAGAGWVRFEPTPADRAAVAPAYTTAELADQDPTQRPSVTRSTELLPDRGDEADRADTAVDEEGSGLPWTTIVLVVLSLALLAALVLTPRLVRRRRRERALAAGVEGSWAELRATVVDLGHGWPPGRSPRRTGDWVGGLLAATVPARERADRPRRGRQQAPEAAQALDRLVVALERSRYARPGTGPGPEYGETLRQDVATVVAALRAGVSGRAERRAEWWPRSVVGTIRRPRRTRPASGGPAPTTKRVDELVG